MDLKNIVIGIAIIILTIFVAFYGINTIFPSPEYEDFCGEPSREVITVQAECEAAGGKWDHTLAARPLEGEIKGYCDEDFTCRQELDDARETRSKKVFLMALPLGIAIIAFGALVFGLEAVGAGLMGGGVGTLIYGSGAYWPYTENWIRFLISLIGLALIIWLAYYFNKKLDKKKKK